MFKKKNTPKSIGFILDGNRRWARKNKLPIIEGHRKGIETLKNTALAAKEEGIKSMVVYAFSTENWKRGKTEVKNLMNVFREFLDTKVQDLEKEGVRIKCIGQVEKFPKDIQKRIKDVETRTKKHKAFTLIVALSYGGRAEIISAIKKLSISELKRLTESKLEQYLWTKDIPDPDLIIRTGGERRLSNFLTWQSVYSEFFFPKVYAPEFTKKDFRDILDEYYERERRYGR